MTEPLPKKVCVGIRQSGGIRSFFQTVLSDAEIGLSLQHESSSDVNSESRASTTTIASTAVPVATVSATPVSPDIGWLSKVS